MSERMVEQMRAKMGLPPQAGTTQTGTATMSAAAATAAAAAAAAAQSATPYAQATGNTAAAAAATAQRWTPQQAAAAALHAQETELQKFLHALSDKRHTVPTALSRRMLQRQGVGYLDDHVGQVVSAAADQFLATVLQQSIACRDQRLQGAEMAKEEARQRQKHMLQHEKDADDRKRRKLADEEAVRKSNLEAIAKAQQLKASGTITASPKSKSKKKKKKDAHEKSNSDMEEELSYDSIDEEEDYYQKFVGNGRVMDDEDDEEEDNQYMLLLRDLERPLQAWNVHLTGKAGLLVDDELDDDDEDESNDEADAAVDRKEAVAAGETNGAGMDGDAKVPPSPAAKKAPSPAPTENAKKASPGPARKKSAKSSTS